MRSLAALWLLAAALAACSDKAREVAASGRNLGVLSVDGKLRAMKSGYIGSPETMAKFLNCWAQQIGPHAATSPVGPPEAGSIDARLPRSARDFFQARRATGFRSLYERITPEHARFQAPSVLKTFKESSPKDFDNWQLAFGTISISDERYYRYDKSQEPAFRGRDLASMLLVGSEVSGAFYLLLPDERTSDDEAEILFLHHGGLIVRFKSFAHLLVHLYLEEREKIAGRDSSLGHLYHYPGKLAETCALGVIEI